MRIIHDPAELQTLALSVKRTGKRIGLVPTMGFLHDGHLSLIDEAKKRSDFVIVSIFVNPVQFGPNEDLDKYPRDFERDRALCEEHGADVVFAPAPEAMYAPDRSVWVEETKLSQGLCGALRPGHFRGVTTVVAKLFLLAQPDVAVFGQKDAQQALVIRRMIRDLNFPIEMVTAPLVRDTDGVALSSRNKYLSPADRERAKVLSQSLFAAQRGELDADGVRKAIAGTADKVDYVVWLDADTLEEPAENTREILVAVAAYFGTTRLIDNMLIQEKK